MLHFGSYFANDIACMFCVSVNPQILRKLAVNTLLQKKGQLLLFGKTCSIKLWVWNLSEAAYTEGQLIASYIFK